jgi:LasA protease
MSLKLIGLAAAVFVLASCQVGQPHKQDAFLAPQGETHMAAVVTSEQMAAEKTHASPSPLATATTTRVPTLTKTIQPSSTPTPARVVYHTQPGDSLAVMLKRFGVTRGDLTSDVQLADSGLLDPGQAVYLPTRFEDAIEVDWLLPDSDIVYGPNAADFNTAAYLAQVGGFLDGHREYLKSTAWTSAAEIIDRIARENSINPRLLLALLEFRCGCVLGYPGEEADLDYMLGNTDYHTKGLYRQLGWAASRLSVGYYGWRGGDLLEYERADGTTFRPSPAWNAGSVALDYLLSFYPQSEWQFAMQPQNGLPALHARMFGDPWARSDPLYTAGVHQPELILPFEPERLWSYTSGPHTVWEKEGAQAALDFAPATNESGCVATDAWAVAVADGVVTRVEFGAVIQDLDDADGTPADGLEQTGWVILYMHIEERDRVTPGTRLKVGERIGHPSCEGGHTTGTHLHLARKYNGEWVLAYGALPFDLEGWVAHAGEKPYEGTLTRGDQTVIARPYGSYVTKIMRPILTPTSEGP